MCTCWNTCGTPYQLKYIQEFRSADFHSPPAMFLEIMLILGLGAAIWYGRRRQFAEVLLIAGFGHLSLVMVRNMPIYILAAAPIVAVPLVAWLKALADGARRGMDQGFVRHFCGDWRRVGSAGAAVAPARGADWW